MGYKLLVDKLMNNSVMNRWIGDGHLKDAKKHAHSLLDVSNVQDSIKKVLSADTSTNHISTPIVHVTSTLWEDSGLEKFARTSTITNGGGEFLWKLIQDPQVDIKVLESRKEAYKHFPETLEARLVELSRLERDVLWLFNMPELKAAWPVNMLFPTAPILRYINKFPGLIEGFHFYRCFAAPYMNIATPISTILGPWIYVRRSLKWMVSLKAYLRLLLTAFGAGFRVTGNLRSDITRVVSIIVYISLFIYTAVQAFETAAMLRKIRSDLKAKLESIRTFIKTAEELVRDIPYSVLAAWGIARPNIDAGMTLPSGISAMYTVLTDNKVKDYIQQLLTATYALDVTMLGKRMLKSHQCCPVQFHDSTQKPIAALWDMGHIMLGSKQTRNPIALTKNLIVTGPNAAGKTTYVKSLFTNIILSQSLGIASARRATIRPVHAIGTFMRVSDTLGKNSLFEAEAQRCAEIVKMAQAISDKGYAGIFFLDEPMHSTPPVEGMSTCRAVLEHLANMEGIRTITTTHYIEVTKVADDIPDKFVNVSMIAIRRNKSDRCTWMEPHAQYTFPYVIRHGPSSQCIALELLHSHELPSQVIARAIELKNKFCPCDVNEDVQL